MTIIGIDGSTTCTGYSVFNNTSLIDYGAVRPIGDNWRDRLVDEGAQIRHILEKYNPDVIYMENVPLFGKQMETLVILGAVQGFMIGIASSMKIPINFLMPSQWRTIVGVYDGTKNGMTKDALKKAAVDKANNLFNLQLNWVKPKSKKNDDDIAEAILIAYSQIKDGE